MPSIQALPRSPAPITRLPSAGAVIRSFLAVALAIAALPPLTAAQPLLWKPVTDSFLRVNDSGVKEWNVFQLEEKDQRYLLQLGGRFLLLDAERKQVFELPPADLERSDAGILWDPAGRPRRPLAASEWVVRDVGLAFRVKMRLDAENRVVDLQLAYPNVRP